MTSINDPKYLQDLEDLFAAYLEAEKTIVSGGQEYTIGDRTLQRADLGFIQRERRRIAGEIAKLQAGRGVRTQRVVVIHDT